MSNIKRIKSPGIQAVAERVKTPGTVDVGIIDVGMEKDSDMTVAAIGFVHEFGSTHIPERSFIRSTTSGKKKEIITLQKQLLKKIVNGDMTVEKGLGILGDFVRGEIQQRIVDIKEPPNSPATIARKGSANPLIDTGQLKGSITFEVNR